MLSYDSVLGFLVIDHKRLKGVEESLTKSDLVRIFSQEVGLTRRNSSDVLSAIIDSIVKALASGEKVTIRNFGTLFVVSGARRKTSRLTDETKGRPSPRNIVRFKSSRILKAWIRDGPTCVKPISPKPIFRIPISLARI